jgi:hypothetical protein
MSQGDDDLKKAFELSYTRHAIRHGFAPQISRVRGGVFSGQYVSMDTELVWDVWNDAIGYATMQSQNLSPNDQ